MRQSHPQGSVGLLQALATFLPHADQEGERISLDAFRGFRKPEEEAPSAQTPVFDWPAQEFYHPDNTLL